MKFVWGVQVVSFIFVLTESKAKPGMHHMLIIWMNE